MVITVDDDVGVLVQGLGQHPKKNFFVDDEKINRISEKNQKKI